MKWLRQPPAPLDRELGRDRSGLDEVRVLPVEAGRAGREDFLLRVLQLPVLPFVVELDGGGTADFQAVSRGQVDGLREEDVSGHGGV